MIGVLFLGLCMMLVLVAIDVIVDLPEEQIFEKWNHQQVFERQV